MAINFKYPGFEDVKFFYDYGPDVNEDVQWYVEMGIIDREDYVLITGEKYPEVEQPNDEKA